MIIYHHFDEFVHILVNEKTSSFVYGFNPDLNFMVEELFTFCKISVSCVDTKQYSYMMRTKHRQEIGKDLNKTGLHLKHINNLQLHIRTFVKFFFKLLEPKRFQVFPSKLQYKKVIRIFFKKKSAKRYEFYMMSNSTVRSTL